MLLLINQSGFLFKDLATVIIIQESARDKSIVIYCRAQRPLIAFVTCCTIGGGGGCRRRRHHPVIII